MATAALRPAASALRVRPGASPRRRAVPLAPVDSTSRALLRSAPRPLRTARRAAAAPRDRVAAIASSVAAIVGAEDDGGADVVILSNGPGEVAAWVRPVVRALRARLGEERDQLRITVREGGRG